MATGCRSVGIARGTLNGVKANGTTSAGGRGGAGTRGGGFGAGRGAGGRGAGVGLGTDAVVRGGLGTLGAGRGGACYTAETTPDAVAAISPMVWRDFRRLPAEGLCCDIVVPDPCKEESGA